MYNSEFSTAEFNSRLREALEKLPEPGSAEERYWRSNFDPPSSEALHKHAARFGPEFVKETAGAFGVPLAGVAAAPKSKDKRQRRTTETVTAKVLNLHQRGVVAAAIADQLNISDRRVATILQAA